nr:MAG TPA: hypothetical protein [Siphoviridae sp. ctnoo6]
MRLIHIAQFSFVFCALFLVIVCIAFVPYI